MTQLLVVDDEAQIAHGIAALLPCEELGIDAVHIAYSAEQALEKLAQFPIGVVLSDIRMPEIDGLTLLRAIKEKWKRTKVIMLTGYADFDYAKGALQGQATDYLLKPVRKEALYAAVKRAIALLGQEWEEIASSQHAMKTLRAHLPELKAKLLIDLAAGHWFTEGDLAEKLDLFSLPFQEGDACTLLLMRFERLARERNPGPNDNALLEYSLENIAVETFSDDFHVWSSRDPHGHLVFLTRSIEVREGIEAGQEHSSRLLERCVVQFHNHVQRFLKVPITVYISSQGQFPVQVASQYEQTLSAVRSSGSHMERFLIRADEIEDAAPGYLQGLHEPPLMRHLFEIGEWDAIEAKLAGALDAVKTPTGISAEHLAELFYTFSAALCKYLHKQGRRLSDSLGDCYERMIEGSPMWTPVELRTWVHDVLDRLRKQSSAEQGGGRSALIVQLQQFMSSHLAEDLSLQRMADHVFLHPTHLSKIYKKETGEGISEYLTRLRMEQAAHLLGSTDVKIYEIGCQTGFTNANYFIKVFRKQFGLTPQEYREKLRRNASGADRVKPDELEKAD